MPHIGRLASDQRHRHELLSNALEGVRAVM